MRRTHPKVDSEETNIEEVLEYYNNHSLVDTANNFNFSIKELRKYFISHNIKLHTRGESNIFSQEQRKNTCMQKYGEENIFQTKHFKQKNKLTKLEKYGNENYNNIEKCIETRVKKYGITNFFQNKEIQHKAELKAHSLESNNKKQETLLKHYGEINPGKVKEIREKINETCMQKYGDVCPARVIHKKYYYNNYYFDSFPELCFYIYCIDNNIQIEREPIRLQFTVNNRKHYYIPDFRVENTLIEIKGNHFIDEDGMWRDLYKKERDLLAKEKYKCAIENNVKILYSEDYQKYIDYFNNKYIKEDYIYNKI